MGNRVQWIEHKGKRILFCDYSHIGDEEEFVQAIVETEKEVLKQAPKTLILMLIDATGSRISPKVTSRARELASAARRRDIPSSPTAIVGLSSPAQRAVFTAMQFLRPDLHTAESVAVAKDWLVERLGK
ncbi:MAG: hypothetical protein JW918_12810 [Anaerolineae bacterium]|nr:hypothetical protein [Anaerolineae bacterium]